MYCKNCGSNIDDRAVICPQCGTETGVGFSTAKPQTEEKYNVMSIIGFVLSFFISIAGLVCSIIARKQCRETGEKGMGFATAGMVISIVSIASSVLAIFIYIVVCVALFGGFAMLM